MSIKFWIFFGIFAVCWYFIGFIAWRIQNDALKRGFGRTSANFWGVGTVFLPFIFIPLYLVFKRAAPGYIVDKEMKPGTTTLCPHCGEMNPKDAVRCSKCEREMSLEVLETLGLKQCPNCGEMNPTDAEYCKKCKQVVGFKD
jgi:ribosomal protein L40E